MDYLPYSQEYMLAVSVMGGMLLGFIWDIYRFFRHYVKLRRLGTAIGDVVYWIISIYIGVELIFDLSYGSVRFFILMGFTAGALLYFYGISRYILKAMIYAADVVIKAVKKVIGVLIGPFRYMVRQLKIFIAPFRQKYEKAKNKAKKRYKFFRFRVKKVLKNRKRVYNKRNNARKKNRQKANKRQSKRRKERQLERRTKDNSTEEKNKQR